MNYDKVPITLNDLILPLATALIAWGGFPKAPEIFKLLAKNVLFQWFLVFVLIWQGGARQRPDLALLATMILFIIGRLLDVSYISGQTTCPVDPTDTSSS